MKSHFLIYLLYISLWLWAASPSPADELPDVSQISVEEARNTMAALDEVQLGNFCEAAMKSERKDLIELCMINPNAAGNISRAMRTMPDSPLRRELILLLLRAPLEWWPDVPGILNTDMLRLGAVISITEYVSPYLPETAITYETIGSPERRLKLADAFESAVARVHGENPAAAQDRANPLPAAAPPSLPGSNPAAARRATAHEAGPAVGGAYAGLWAGGALLLVAAGVWYIGTAPADAPRASLEVATAT